MSAKGQKRIRRRTQSMSLLGVKQTRIFVPQVCLRPKVDCNGNNHQFLVSKKQETLEVICQLDTLITIADAGRGNYFSQKHRWHGASTISISQYIKTRVRPTDQRGIWVLERSEHQTDAAYHSERTQGSPDCGRIHSGTGAKFGWR